jgi:hypothetical protein
VAGDVLLDVGEVLPQAVLALHRAHPVPPFGSSRWPSRHWTRSFRSSRTGAHDGKSIVAFKGCPPPLDRARFASKIMIGRQRRPSINAAT